jgi:hypothetical protein
MAELVTEQIVSLLEENWDELKTDLGTRWDEFLVSYGALVKPLPPEPTMEDVAGATIKLLGLLHQFEGGRRLLKNNPDLQTRLVGSGPATLPNKVRVKQVANRFIDLLKREEAKKRESKDSNARNAKND